MTRRVVMTIGFAVLYLLGFVAMLILVVNMWSSVF
jgi:hypothetical protein